MFDFHAAEVKLSKNFFLVFFIIIIVLLCPSHFCWNISTLSPLVDALYKSFVWKEFLDIKEPNNVLSSVVNCNVDMNVNNLNNIGN